MIRKQTFGKYQEYYLLNPDTSDAIYILPELGGIVRKIILGKNGNTYEILNAGDTEALLLSDTAYPSRHLFPFPSRMNQGKYTFEGIDYQLPVNDVSRGHAIHGFVANQVFEVLETSDLSIRLGFNYTGDYQGFPFPFSFELTYFLTELGVELQYHITNTGTQNFPYGLGWHPYFKLGEEKTDNWEIWFDPKAKIKLNESMIAEGQEPFELSDWFDLKGKTLDNAFLIHTSAKPHITTLRSVNQGITLNIWQDCNHEYLVVYTPPERNRIAIEPLTCNVDAFNNGEGLQVLKAGGTVEMFYGVSLNLDI